MAWLWDQIRRHDWDLWYEWAPANHNGPPWNRTITRKSSI